MHILIAIIIALPAIAWGSFGLRVLKERRKRGVPIDVGGKISTEPPALETIPDLPLHEQAPSLMKAASNGSFLMHLLTNDAKAHDDEAALRQYRSFMAEPCNVEAVRKIAEWRPEDE